MRRARASAGPPAAGDCDGADNCAGTSADCPPDTFEPSTTECRAAAGVCDAAEFCTGSSASCPADAKSTAVCRAAAGACDVAESCDGVTNDCPADLFKPSSTECRDRKSTRLNSSHRCISYAVFCL